VRAYDVDERKHDRFNINLAFKNRNTSRVLVQNLRRWDWVWHLGTSVTWSRLFDFIGLFPIIGFTRFPATENFPASRNHALAGIFRLIFEGTWLTRFFTSNQQVIVTFDRHTAAQNLAAESTGFEGSNRNQHGTFFGREKTNAFRFEHRLPTDESIVRTFQTSPAGTSKYRKWFVRSTYFGSPTETHTDSSFRNFFFEQWSTTVSSTSSVASPNTGATCSIRRTETLPISAWNS